MSNTKTKSGVPALFKKSEFITIVIFAVMLVLVAVMQGNFFKPSSLQNTIISWTPLILLTMGQAVVLLSGGLDMSSGNAMSFMLCVLAGTMEKDNPQSGVIALVLCVLVMLIVGLVNGLAVGYFKLPPIIATFATSYIWLGAALFIMPSPGGVCVNWMRAFYKFSSVDNMPPALQSFGSYIPTGVLLIIAAVVIWFIVSRTKLGRYMYAVGSNRNIAYESGIKTVKVQIMAYMINSLFIMFAALFLVGENQSGSARIGDPLTLECIAAAIVGGVVLAGGKGNVFVAIAGAAIISLVTKLIYFTGISSDWQTLVSGLILLIAIASSAIIAAFKKLMAKREVRANE